MLNRWLNFITGGRKALFDNLGLLLLRLTFGGFMAFGHGWGKLTRFGELATRFSDPIGIGGTPSLVLAVFAEFFCAIAVMLGLATRLTTIPPMITMAVAAFIVHAPDPFGRKEKALLFLSVYLVLFLIGAGRYSLDTVLFKNRD
jgi:putative oxidoreductase